MRKRVNGAMNVEPKLSPAETSATASVRLRVNQRVVVAVMGAYRLPAARPTITPNKTWNHPSVDARLAVTNPVPRRRPPERTTMRVPNRSDRIPQANAPALIDRKLSRAAVAMPVRDQPMAAAMGWRNTLSDIMAPNPTHVTTMPTATTTQP